MIRKYENSDQNQILTIWKDASTLAHPFLDEAFVKQVSKDMRDIYLPNAETWVFHRNNELLGFISMIDNEIGGLFVSSQHHSQGIGGKLVDFVLAKHAKLEVEVFVDNKIGRAFYAKYGFKEMKEFLHEPSQQRVLRLSYN